MRGQKMEAQQSGHHLRNREVFKLDDGALLLPSRERPIIVHHEHLRMPTGSARPLSFALRSFSREAARYVLAEM